MLSGDSQIKKGAAVSYFSIGLNILAGLLYTPWMIGKIGQSQYGLYTLANSLLTLFLLDFGLGSATARFVAKFRAAGKEDQVNNFLGIIYKLYIVIDAVIFAALIIVYFLIDLIYVKLTAEELSQFKTVYLIAAGFSVINFPFLTLNGVLTAYDRFVELKVADIIHRVLILGLMGIALSMGYGLFALVTVNAVAGLLTILYKLMVIGKTTPIKPNYRYSDRSLYKEIFGFSFWITVANLAQRLIFNITPSILGFVSNSAAIAVFGVITTIEGYVFTITGAINGMFLPRISHIYTEKDARKKLLPLMLEVGRFEYALNGLIVAGFAVVGREFISLWMGDAFRDAYYGILLIVIPGLFFNPLQIANTAVTLSDHVASYAYVHVAMGVLNVVLSLILSGIYGVIGACVSIAIAYTVRAVGLHILYHKKLRIDMAYFAKQCYLRMSIPIILTVAIGFWVTSLMAMEGWLGVILKGAVVAVIYAVTVLVFGIDDRKKLFKSVLGRS